MTAPSPAGQTPADRSEADLIERVARWLYEFQFGQGAWEDWLTDADYERFMAKAGELLAVVRPAAAVEVLRGEGR